MAYHKFVPVPVIDTVFILTAIFAGVSAFVGIKRLWSGMKAQAGEMKSSGNLVGDIISSVTTILAHSKFADCNVNRLRQWGHMILFYSFAGLAVVTTWAIIYLYGYELLGIQAFGPFHFGESPYPNSRSREDPGAGQLHRICGRLHHHSVSTGLPRQARRAWVPISTGYSS